jgi:hypothetical protein
VGLERDPLSLVSKIEELLERKSIGFDLENRDYGRRDPSRWPRGILCPQTLALTSPTNGDRSVGIVRSRTHATEFFLIFNSDLRMEKRCTLRNLVLFSMPDDGHNVRTH